MSIYETRYAIDLGSTGLGIYGFFIDPINKLVLREIYSNKVRFLLQGSIKDGILPINIQYDVIDAIKQFLDEIRPTNEVVGIATAWARSANNSQEFLDLIYAETGVLITIVDQYTEGAIGLEAILAQIRLTDIDPSKVVSWDIGGGSMQFAKQNERGTIEVIGSTDSSTLFANAVIQYIKEQPLSVGTPNPLTLDQMERAIDLAMQYASKLIDNSFLESCNDCIIYGIGMMHKSNLQYINTLCGLNYTDHYTLRDLKHSANILVNKNNDQIAEMLGFKSADARNRLTSMLLLIGYMTYLGIDQVNIMDITGISGIFFI